MSTQPQQQTTPTTPEVDHLWTYDGDERHGGKVPALVGIPAGTGPNGQDCISATQHQITRWFLAMAQGSWAGGLAVRSSADVFPGDAGLHVLRYVAASRVHDENYTLTYDRDPARPGRYIVDEFDLTDRGLAPAYRCEACGLTDTTDDLTVIGRNCPATGFDQPHAMASTCRVCRDDDHPADCTRHGACCDSCHDADPEPADPEADRTPGDDWRDDAERFGGYPQMVVTVEAAHDLTDFGLTGEQVRVVFTALADHADGTRVPPLSGAARSYLSDLFDVDGGENCTDAVHAEVRAWLAVQRGTPAPPAPVAEAEDGDGPTLYRLVRADLDDAAREVGGRPLTDDEARYAVKGVETMVGEGLRDIVNAVID